MLGDTASRASGEEAEIAISAPPYSASRPDVVGVSKGVTARRVFVSPGTLYGDESRPQHAANCGVARIAKDDARFPQLAAGKRAYTSGVAPQPTWGPPQYVGICAVPRSGDLRGP